MRPMKLTKSWHAVSLLIRPCLSLIVHISTYTLIFQPNYSGLVQNPSSYGYGCDGFDSNCDVSRLIDECAEDLYAPDIDLSAALSCKEQTFAEPDDAKACILDKVVAFDDCLPVLVDAVVVPEATACTTTISVTATAQGCGDRPTEDTTTVSITGIKVDSTPPVVSCDLAATGLQGKTNAFVDASLTFSAIDGCGASSVLLEAYSSEELENANNLVVFSSPVNGTDVKLFVDDDYCNKGSGEGSGKCKVDNEKEARKYVVRITGTDGSGNSASSTCDLIVGKDDPEGPLFLLSSIEAQ